MVRPTSAPLAEAAWRGVRVAWQAVRGRLNTAADRLATWALHQARELLRRHQPEPRVVQGLG
eukprot:2509253-Alexandrium_andersonii.AAC.1